MTTTYFDCGTVHIDDDLVRTGVATNVGMWLVSVAGSSEIKMLVLLMVTVAGLGLL